MKGNMKYSALGKIALGVVLAAGVASVAPAAQAADGFKGKSAGDFVIRARAIGVIPRDNADNASIAGEPDVSNEYVPEHDFTYFLTDNVALELIAAQYGFRDWNTLHAKVGNRPPLNPWMLGARVSGTYLGHPFTAEVISVQALQNRPGYYRLTMKFDEAIDVVTFESFSAFRRRINCTIDETGRSPAKTSDGRPHVELSW